MLKLTSSEKENNFGLSRLRFGRFERHGNLNANDPKFTSKNWPTSRHQAFLILWALAVILSSQTLRAGRTCVFFDFNGGGTHGLLSWRA
jgi:hypothetical protein